MYVIIIFHFIDEWITVSVLMLWEWLTYFLRTLSGFYNTKFLCLLCMKLGACGLFTLCMYIMVMDFYFYFQPQSPTCLVEDLTEILRKEQDLSDSQYETDSSLLYLNQRVCINLLWKLLMKVMTFGHSKRQSTSPGVRLTEIFHLSTLTVWIVSF